MRRLLAIALLGLLVVLAAGLFDAEALWVPGVGLIALAVLLAGTLLLAARGARVERRLGAARAVEQEPVAVTVRVDAGRLPLAAGRVDAGDGGPPLVRLAAGRRHAQATRELAFTRRGRHRLAPAALVLDDPLGLGRRTVRGAGEDEVLVLPRLYPVRALAPGASASDGAAVALALGLGAASEPDGLRPYRDGTPATRIHWPALARGAGLVERRMLPDAERVPLLVVDPSGPAPEEALDAAVRAAASLAVALARAGGVSLLLPGDRRATLLDEQLAAWPALHARLALLAAGPPPPLGGHLHRHRSLLYVAARLPARLPAALSAGPRAARVLVAPGADGPWPPQFEVAGCRGYAVGGARAAEAVA